MSYANAPQTKFLATNCLCCGLPLVHAESVERGIGPECSKQGYPLEESGNENVKVAQKLIYEAAIKAQQGNVVSVLESANSLFELGFPEVAKKILKRFQNLEATAQKNAKIVINTVGGFYVVKTPYKRSQSQDFVNAWRNIKGRFYRSGSNHIPLTEKRALWNLLKRFFPGQAILVDGNVVRVP